MGALRLPDRQPVHPRGASRSRRTRTSSSRARSGGYKGEKLSLNFQNVEVRAVLQVIADFTGLNIITSDTVDGQPHAAPEGHSVGPGARHHPADQGPRHAQERQCRADRAARGAGAEGEAAARERASRSRELEPLVTESFQLNYMKATDFAAASSRRNRQQQFGAGAGQTATTGGQGSILSQARRRDRRPAHQHPVRAGHRVAAGGGAQDHPPDRHADPPGDDRGAHRHRQRQVQPAARRALRRADRLHVQQSTRSARAAASTRSRSSTCRATSSSATRGRRRRSSSRPASRRPATPTRRSSTSTCRSPMPPASSR